MLLCTTTSDVVVSYILFTEEPTMYYFLDVDIVIGMYNDAKVGGDRENIEPPNHPARSQEEKILY